MADPLITLTTDFGPSSPYVAAMKGVILGVNPSVRLVDLTHEVPPQDIRHASFFLASALPYFPAGTLHLVVVDPGVGTPRKILYFEAARQRLLVPDNGCTSGFFGLVGPPIVAREVSEKRFWRTRVSSTFHGRDIFAPVAGQLSLGLDPAKLGPIADKWIQWESRVSQRKGNFLVGEVIFIDTFGNLITDIPAEKTNQAQVSIKVGNQTLPKASWVNAYGDAKVGSLVALISSQSTAEIAVVGGNAAKRLKARIGTAVQFKLPAK